MTTWDEVIEQLTGPGADFEMVEAVVRGQRLRVFRHGPATLREVVEGFPGHGTADHLVMGDRRLDFAATYARVAGLARHLVDECGVRPGDRVAIAARNLPEWPIAFWAAVSVGAIATPLNAWWTGDELAFALEDAEPRVLVADDERLDRLAGLLPSALTVLTTGASRPGAVPMSDLADGSELPSHSPDPDDEATLFYTSGTTGRPKGVLGTHRNMLTNLMGVRWRLASMHALDGTSQPASPHQRALLLGVPLFHVTGAHSVMLPAAAMGAKLVMMWRWDPAEAVRLVEQERITAFTGVPTMGWELLRHPDAEHADLSSLTYLGAGGAPSPPELVRLVDSRLGVPAGNGYGMTETSALAVVNAGRGYRDDPASIGRPVPCNDVALLDDEGRPVPDGEPGELAVRGPCVTVGYWRRPEETAETFVDGWVRTGDVAVLLPDGRLRIVDRKKDIVIRGGENISTVEVEAALYEHPAVQEVVVVGHPDERLGEVPVAVVVPSEPVTVDELREHAAARLARFKVPERIVIRDEPLPRNGAGKFLKRELRDELSGSE